MEPKSRRISPSQRLGAGHEAELQCGENGRGLVLLALALQGGWTLWCRLPCKRWRKERRSLSLGRAATCAQRRLLWPRAARGPAASRPPSRPPPAPCQERAFVSLIAQSLSISGTGFSVGSLKACNGYGAAPPMPQSDAQSRARLATSHNPFAGPRPVNSNSLGRFHR